MADEPRLRADYGVGLTTPLMGVTPERQFLLPDYGGGKPTGTPLSPPPKDPRAYIDTTLTPQQKAEYFKSGAPDVGGGLDNFLASQRQVVEGLLPGILGGAAGALVGGGIGGIPGFIAGMGTNALVSGGADYLQNRDPLKAVTEGGLNAVLHGLGGARSAVHGRNIRQGVLGQTYDERLKAFGQAAATHEAQAVALADGLKKSVPVWGNVESSGRGLSQMIGPGWTKVREAYDTMLRNAIGGARGQRVQISAEAARDLRVDAPVLIQTSKAKVNPTTDLVEVDAAELLQKMVGRSRNTPRSYAEAAAVLDEAGIGDPAIRKMYREALSFKSFAEKFHIVEDGIFRPDRVQKGLASVQPKRAADIRQSDLDPLLREAKPVLAPDDPRWASPISKVGAGHSGAADFVGRAAADAAGMSWHGQAAAGRFLNKFVPGASKYQTTPHSPLGGETGFGPSLTTPQSLMVNAEGAGIGLGLRAGGEEIKQSWRFILDWMGKGGPEPDAPKKSPLEPDAPMTPVRPPSAVEEN